MDIQKTVSFSGYRPEKLPDFGVETAFSIATLKADLCEAVVQAISHGFDTFLVGMAEGFDMYAAESVTEHKLKYPTIKLISVVPFEDGCVHTQRYTDILNNADEIVTLSDEYTRGSYYTRNEYMINNSSLLICYYDGRVGGTEYTIEYATKKGVEVINLAPNDIEFLKTFDNVTELVRDDLERTIKKDSKLSIAAACFSIYAYDELKRRLKGVKELRFVFTSPTFTTDKIPKSKREFYIPRLSRERSLYGTEFEVRLRNEMIQKAIAKECAEWISKKVKFKSNTTTQNIPGFMNVENDKNRYTYMPLNGFTTVDIGCERGDNAFNFVNRAAQSKKYLDMFESLWNSKDKLEDVTDEVIDSITAVYKENPAEYVYFLTLYNIFNEFLEDILPNEALGFKDSVIWNKLYSFQKDAALAIITKLEKYNGCILADSVGLGKTFTALSVIKYYEKRNKDVLVLCPKKLADNWKTYNGKYVNNPLRADRFDYTVLYHTDLGREEGFSGDTNLSKIDWANYGLVVIDESHNFRNGGELRGEDNEKENRYLKLLNKVIRAGIPTKVLMLSATPVNNRFNDLKNQLALAYEGEAKNIDGKLNTSRSINDVFRNAQRVFNEWSKLKPELRTTASLQKMLDFDFFEVLDSVTIARSRKQIEKHYDTTDVGKFPKRNKNISKTPPLTDLSDAITYNQIFDNLMELNLSIYTPTRYILQSKQKKYAEIISDKDMSFVLGREQGIRRLMAINLMKRMESSVFSFSLTLNRIKEQIENTISIINEFEKGLENGTLNLTDISNMANGEYDDDDWEATTAQNGDLFSIGKNVKIDLADMDFISWRRNLQNDTQVLELLSLMTADITPRHDSKLQELISVVKNKIENPINHGNKKVIIFTAFADTAGYLYEHISAVVKNAYGLNTAMITGSVDGKTTIPKFKTDLNSVLTLFSPRSKEKALTMPNSSEEIDVIIATDCISEGQNLQDCDFLVNYDIHWNPVRIIQRFGRIDRIGSTNESIQLVNFWPNLTLDEYINLKTRVETRMKIVDITATGDDNILSEEEKGDMEYRRKQLEKLQTEIVDLEDISGGISIMDLGLNEFRMDLLAYMKENPEIEKSPFGLHSVVSGDKNGIIFVLKNINKGVNLESKNRLHPFYMVYMGIDGEVISTHLEPKATLDTLRLLCRGKKEPDKELCRIFNKQTRDGKNMGEVSDLLQKTIASIVSVKEESDLDSFFGGDDMSFLGSDIKGLNDFELITFVVVRGDINA